MKRLYSGLVLLGVAAGVGLVVRNYLQEGAGTVQGEVRITLEGGAEVQPDPVEAREFVDIARRVLEISG